MKVLAGQSHDDFIAEIQTSITNLIKRDKEKVFQRVLWEELNSVLTSLNQEEVDDSASEIAEGLITAIRINGNECKVIIRALSGVVFRCFDSGETDSVFDSIDNTYRNKIQTWVEQVLGYLVLSLVNPEDAKSIIGDHLLSDLYLELNVQTRGGVELFMSYKQNRPAEIELNTNSRRVDVMGKHIIFVDVSPFQWQTKAKLQETQLIIWNVLRDEERREFLNEAELEKLTMIVDGSYPEHWRTSDPLSNHELSRLGADLVSSGIKRRNPRHYCLALQFDNEEADRDYISQCSSFLEKLKVPLIRYGVSDSSPAFFGHEDSLMSAITTFLKDFETCKAL